ncbi:MAG: DUF2784 domain-containing protein [Gammaproteobacteria bacterium]|nr:DUF2784 domain-containing protein [Gammaproteobacteria bacterium]
MIYRISADAVLLLHLLFVVFVVAGALLVIRTPVLAWLHVPAACWGLFVELTGRICPLTTLENHLLVKAGIGGYPESFVEHYLVPIIYPSGLTRGVQITMAAIVALINGAAYGWMIYKWRRDGSAA